ncbi:MAG TPA: ABC transporter substrate-binding protein [Candidatus Limnocylindrales bacterium]|nr:ABC transporter substrate-binding protein [Candidatus Limnocylindrales bacterium]
MVVAHRRRVGRVLAAFGVLAALLLPAVPVAAQEPLVLRVGTTQDLDSMNPWGTALTVGFEAYTLNYETIAYWDENLAPMPAFAESWEESEDGLTWTFTISPDKKWSDGTPATAEDARWTYQLVLDALAAETSVGLGYIDYYLGDAGVTAVSAPDSQTFVVEVSAPTTRLIPNYVPILPKHIWEGQTLDTIGDFQNEPPVVGSGPYQAVEWQIGQSVRFVRNEHFTGRQGAADEVIIQFYANAVDTMVQALQNGELDYARAVLPDQFNQLTGQPNIVTVAGTTNGFTELGFNTYGTGTGKTIPNGGPSTPALLDAAFRDALGYAIDKELLVERILGGYGEVGTTQVPPFQTAWHTPPATPRTFDMELARQKLDAAGYVLNDAGARLDKDGNPIVLELVFPDSEETFAQAAEFVADWFGQLGIVVNSQQYDQDTLIDKMLPPEAGEEYTADYDLFIWSWGGDVDPNSLLSIFKCDEIGASSDSMYCNPRYDELYALQNATSDPAERKRYMDEMQAIIYDDAPYHILFYDAQLDAYRTDRFGGWQNQPSNGVPLFVYGPLDYTLLTAAEPSPEPSQPAGSPSAGAATPAPSPGAEPTASGGDSTLLIVGVLAVVAILAVGLVLFRRRGPTTEEE